MIGGLSAHASSRAGRRASAEWVSSAPTRFPRRCAIDHRRSPDCRSVAGVRDPFRYESACVTVRSANRADRGCDRPDRNTRCTDVPAMPCCTTSRYARTVSRTSVMSRCDSRLPTRSTGSSQTRLDLGDLASEARRHIGRGLSWSRVIERPHDEHGPVSRRAAPAFPAPACSRRTDLTVRSHRLRAESSVDGRYTSADPVTRTGQWRPASRTPSSTWCVPSTLTLNARTGFDQDSPTCAIPAQ